MKKLTLLTVTIIAGAVLFAFSVTASEAMDMQGNKIHSSKVNDYDFTYSLIDMEKKAKEAGLSQDMKNTYHLMVHIKKGGEFVNNLKAGFVVEKPDGTVSKVMAMGMSKGYGADLHMPDKGKYKIKIKAVKNGKKVMDSFTYDLK
jgi:hypothetical protein